MSSASADIEARVAALEAAVGELRSCCERFAAAIGRLEASVAALEGAGAAARAPAPPARAEPPVVASASAPRASASAHRLLVVCLEQDPGVQEALCAALAKVPGAEAAFGEEALADGDERPRVFAANLLLAGYNPLLALASAADWSVAPPRAFLYLWEAAAGSVLGVADIFPPPFDPAACASRLASGCVEPPAVLIVSEDLDATVPLQEAFRAAGVNASVAFNLRQALEVAPITAPDAVLADLRLPRVEGLRAALRLGAGRPGSRLRLGLFWRGHVPVEPFQRDARRLLRESPTGAAGIAAALARHLAPGGALFGAAV